MIALSLKVTFRKQGTKLPATGTAIGRLGKQVLIRYRIESGETRERWFPPARVFELESGFEYLPRYKGRTCKARRFPEPIIRAEFLKWRAGFCETCQRLHQADFRVFVDGIETKSRNSYDLVPDELEGWLDRTNWVRDHTASKVIGVTSLKLEPRLV